MRWFLIPNRKQISESETAKPGQEKTKPTASVGFGILRLGADSGRKRLAGRFRLNRKSTALKGGNGNAESLQNPIPALASVSDSGNRFDCSAALA